MKFFSSVFSIMLLLIEIIIVLSGNILLYAKNEQNDLKDWFNQVKSPSFTCPQPECLAVNDENTIPLVKVIDCMAPGAIYEYDFKVNVRSYNNYWQTL